MGREIIRDQYYLLCEEHLGHESVGQSREVVHRVYAGHVLNYVVRVEILVVHPDGRTQHIVHVGQRKGSVVLGGADKHRQVLLAALALLPEVVWGVWQHVARSADRHSKATDCVNATGSTHHLFACDKRWD